MKANAMLVACLSFVAAGCTEPGTPPTAVSVDRSYVLTSCLIGTTPGVPPCEVHFTPSSIQYVDSARIDVRADGTFLWVGFVHTEVCKYGGTCQTNPLRTHSDTLAGSYSIQRDTLTFGLTRDSQGPGEAVEAYGLVAGARRPWPGPDSLVVNHYQGGHVTTYRPK